MSGRLAQLLLAAAIGSGLAAPSAAGAIALGDSIPVQESPASRALTAGGCQAGAGLDASVSTQEKAMLCLVDEARAKNGLPPLSESPQLLSSALDKGEDLIRCNEFSHTACGREFSYWIRESGYMSPACWRAGENLAWGVDRQGTVASIFRAWMRSPSHRENILGEFEETGVELRVGDLGGLAGVHVWVQHFGSHCG